MDRLENVLVKNLNKQIEMLNQIMDELKGKHEDIEIEYYLRETIPELEREIKTLQKYVINEEVHYNNKRFNEVTRTQGIENTILYKTYKNLKIFITSTKTELEIYLEK